jgi:hypothetical protein
MVPEVTNVDKDQLKKLQLAKDDDIFLSFNSPLGVPFWNLRNSASEEAKLQRIKDGNPGSRCVKGFGKINYEFTKLPICRASQAYQKRKLEELQSMNLSAQQLAAHREEVLNKSCICHDLAGGATIKRNIDPKATSAICPGPNIVNFKKIMTLKEMVGHIYGRCSVLTNENRPHLFIREIQLHIDFLLDQIIKASFNIPTKSSKKLAEAKENLLKGIGYYQKHAKEFFQSEDVEQTLALQVSQLKGIC